MVTKTLLKMVSLLALGTLCERTWALDTDTASLPPVEVIVERAFARAKLEPENDRTFNATYGYTRSKVTEYRNIRGNLTKRKEKITVNEPAESRGGDRADPGVRDPRQNTNAVTSDVSKHKRDMLSDTNLMNRFSFELRGREMIAGRPALVVDFKPASRTLPAPTLKDQFLNKAAGRVWLDEEDYALMKAEAHLTDKVNVIGGLVATVHKFNFAFERERTEEGLWFTRNLTWCVKAREVIVERVIDCVETRTDVRKME